MALRDIIKKCKKTLFSCEKCEKCEKCGLPLSQCKCNNSCDQEERDGCDKCDDETCEE